MTTQQAGATQGFAEALDDEAVVSFLIAHPDFFERHPDLVARLRVPHDAGGAVSLIEHQVGVLRAQFNTERRRFRHLIDRARDYEALAARFHGLVLLLIAAPDLERVAAVLHHDLCQALNAEAVALKLFPVQPDPADPDPLVGAFLGFLGRDRSLCGPLDAERNGALFDAQGEAVRSAALIPIRGGDSAGVLAIGSSDPARFGPDLGTELLDRLGEIVSAKLRVLRQGNG